MATRHVQDEITQFFDHYRRVSAYFRKQLTPDSHSPADHEFLAAKMACCALLDALSVARFPKKGVGERFGELVREFSKCEYWDNVSIPQLLYTLQRSGDVGNKPLGQYAKKQLTDKLTDKTEYDIRDDPPCNQLIARFPESQKAIEDCRHSSLFYYYRCALVHEMRQSGSGLELEHDVRPCYRISTEIDIEAETGRRTFQLTYPLRFFFSVCDECIDNLEQYFLGENKSPFEAYESRFGDVWKHTS